MPKTPKTKQPRKGGRPSRYTDTVAAEICRRIAEGESLRKVCADSGMPGLSTVMAWLADGEHKSFLEQYARARDMQADAFFDEAVDIANDVSGVWTTTEDGKKVFHHEHVQRSKLRVDTLKWAASKLAPKRYGERINIDTPANDEPEESSEQSKLWTTQLQKALAAPGEAGKVVPLSRPKK